jgi:hypothetical protein
MILQELIDILAKPRKRNTILIIQDSSYNELCVCGTDDIPEEYLNLVIIDWNFDVSINLGFTDGEQFSLSVDLEVRVECL